MINIFFNSNGFDSIFSELLGSAYDKVICDNNCKLRFIFVILLKIISCYLREKEKCALCEKFSNVFVKGIFILNDHIRVASSV